MIAIIKHRGMEKRLLATEICRAMPDLRTIIKQCGVKKLPLATACMGEVLRSPERTEILGLNTIHTLMSSRTNVRDLVRHRTRSLTFVRDDSLYLSPHT